MIHRKNERVQRRRLLITRWYEAHDDLIARLSLLRGITYLRQGNYGEAKEGTGIRASFISEESLHLRI